MRITNVKPTKPSDKQARIKLDQLLDIKKELPSDPQTQDMYDMIDDVNDEIARLRKQLNIPDDVSEAATNHMGENEIRSYARWKATIKRAFPTAKIDGDKDIANAHVDGKGVGEWDGEVGVVYDNAHVKRRLSEDTSWQDEVKGWAKALVARRNAEAAENERDARASMRREEERQRKRLANTPPEKLAMLKRHLEDLKQTRDPHFQYSDNYAYVERQRAIPVEIAELEREIAQIEQLQSSPVSESVSPAAAYTKATHEIDRLLASLGDKLRTHKQRFDRDDTNWGFVGDLQEVVSKLRQADRFLK